MYKVLSELVVSLFKSHCNKAQEMLGAHRSLWLGQQQPTAGVSELPLHEP